MPYIDRVDNTVAYRGSDTIEHYVVASGQTVKRGDFVTLTSGTITQALAKSGTANTVVTEGTTQLVLAGMCLHGGAAGETVAVLLAKEETNFLLRVIHATAASAEQQDVTLGTAYRLGIITIGTSGPGYYGMSTITTAATNPATIGTPELVLVEKSPESAVGDDFGFVWCAVKPGSRAHS